MHVIWGNACATGLPNPPEVYREVAIFGYLSPSQLVTGTWNLRSWSSLTSVNILTLELATLRHCTVLQDKLFIAQTSRMTDEKISKK